MNNKIKYNSKTTNPYTANRKKSEGYNFDDEGETIEIKCECVYVIHRYGLQKKNMQTPTLEVHI